ncbi:MAG: hypothetical protein U1E51_04630, partial [Candidatus Binatia bacterium]|nr:hypothetical protein [Candidatus Binatia bacterium]
ADTTGRMQPLAHEKYATEYLVWASSRLVLVHEFSHAVLQLFDHTGIDPCEAGGEPFAYLLEHLLAEAWKK